MSRNQSHIDAMKSSEWRNSPNTRATKTHREFASWKTSLVRI